MGQSSSAAMLMLSMVRNQRKSEKKEREVRNMAGAQQISAVANRHFCFHISLLSCFRITWCSRSGFVSYKRLYTNTPVSVGLWAASIHA